MKLKQLTFALLMSLGLVANAANTKTTVTQVTEGVQLTTDVDYIVTGTEPFTTAGSVDIVSTDHAVLILSSIKPSVVLKKWMNYIYINGEAAVDGTNCQVKMYNRGTIIFPYASNIQPLTCYTEQNYEGESCSNYSEGHSGGYMKTLTTALLNNQIRSFKLKRGYMVTFAIGTSGWGYSRCFIADQEDLEVATLPNILDKRISSYRIFKWHNAHKAGLASNGNAAANQALNTSWCYDWAEGNENNLPDTEWVPNHIYEDYPSSAKCGSVAGSCHMKTNNEPGNSADDHPQSVDVVLGNWQNLMRTGMRLCSESSHDGSWSHLRAFIDSIDARGWRCDLLDLHCYWSSGFAGLQSYYSSYGGRPIWISEWIWGASWNHNGAFGNGVTDAQILSRTQEILESLNANKYVERYAYWNSESKAHIYESGKLTDLGKYYATMDAGIGYDASIQKIPTATRLENLSELTSTFNSKKGNLTLSWDDPNGDLTTSITVQCKLPETSTWTPVATLTPKDMSSSAGASYTYTETLTEPGVYVYRVKAVSYTNKTFTSNEVTVDVAPAQGTEDIQYGKLTLTTLDATDLLYSQTFEEVPCVFIGTLKNNNASLYAGNITAATNTKTKFSYQLYPWQTNKGEFSKTEEVPFLALKSGNYKYGTLDCEVNVADANKATGEDNWTDVTEVTFQQPFPEGVTPIVLTEIRNPGYISADPKTTLCTRIFDVTNTGFKFIIYSEYASGRKISLSKKVCYLAITPGIGMVDEENGIMIAAGLGTDNKMFGSNVVLRANNFYVEKDNEETGNPEQEQLYLYQPTILTALQTNNYPAVCMLRRTDLTEKDEDGVAWTYGTKVRRILDHDLSSDVTTKTSDEAYSDNLGWVAIAQYREGGSKPAVTAIHGISADTQGKSLRPHVIGRRIYVDGAATFEVYNAAGAKVSAQAIQSPGIYVVKANGKTTKVLVK